MVRKNVMSNFLKFSSFMSLVRNCLSFLKLIEKSSKQTQTPSSNNSLSSIGVVVIPFLNLSK